MERKKLQYTVSTVLTREEYHELQRYIRAGDKSVSATLRALLVPQIHALVTARETAHGLGNR